MTVGRPRDGAGGRGAGGVPAIGPLLAARLSLASHIHPSWIPDMAPPGAWSVLFGRPGNRARLSEVVRQRFGIGDPVPGEEETVCGTLALLAPDALADRLFLAGLVINRQPIGREVRRDRRARLQQVLGERGYRFALHRAPYIADPSWGAPDTVVAALDPLDPSLARRLLADGLSCLLAGGGGHLRTIAVLKLPKGLAEESAARPLPIPDGAAAMLLRKLLREGEEGIWPGCS